MHTKMIIYTCDFCGKTRQYEQKKDSEFVEADIPAKIFTDDHTDFNRGTAIVELCRECYEKYWEYISKRYEVADIPYVGIRAKIKEDEP